MIIILQKNISKSNLDKIMQKLKNFRFENFVSFDQPFIFVESSNDTLPEHYFNGLAGINKIIRTNIRTPKILNDTKVNIEVSNYPGLRIPAIDKPIIIAGPCSIESESQILSLSLKLKKLGVSLLRGGAFKPRTNPYDFQGLGLNGLKFIKQASIESKLPVVSEVMSAKQLDLGYNYIDIFQVGARNMYNYELLKELGQQKKPVLLKRHFSATVDELLQAAEYLYDCGNSNVILCERGIRSFETTTRNTIDLNSVAYLKENFNLPVIVDPSHGTGNSLLVKPMSNASIASGACGLIIEVHEDPANSISDSRQAINLNQLEDIINTTNLIWRITNPDFTRQEIESANLVQNNFLATNKTLA